MAKKRKLTKSIEWIKDEYINKNRKREDIAKECGLTLAGLKSVLFANHIVKPKIEISEDILKDLVNQDKTADEIAKILHCSKTSIYRRLDKYNLKILVEQNVEQYDDSKDELMASMYQDGFSSTQIAKELGITHCTVLHHLKRYGIKTRNASECQWNYNNKEIPEILKNRDLLYQEYVIERKTKKQLGKEYGCDPSTFNTALKKFGIPIRNDSESKMGMYIGDKHPNWKGGITSLYARLRQYNQDHLNPIVLRRENYTCELCGSHKNLCVHHKKSFYSILKRILSEHPDLDPQKNVNELYEIAIKDSELNDINNLEVYCRSCHLYKVHKYRPRNLVCGD